MTNHTRIFINASPSNVWANKYYKGMLFIYMCQQIDSDMICCALSVVIRKINHCNVMTNHILVVIMMTK